MGSGCSKSNAVEPSDGSAGGFGDTRPQTVENEGHDDVSRDRRAVNRKAIVSAFPSRFTEVEGRSKFGVDWAHLVPHLSFDRSADPPTAACDDLDAALEAAGLDRLPSGSFYSNLLHFAAVNTGMEAVFKDLPPSASTIIYR